MFAPRPGLRAEVEAAYLRGLDDPDVVHVVAERDGRVIGMARARIAVPSAFSDERAAEVSHVVVLPRERGAGVGRALVVELAGFARSRGVGRLSLKSYDQNEGAMRFWRGLGFRPRYVQLTAAVDDLEPPAG